MNIRSLPLSSGREIPVLGQGTWRMGEKATQRQAEVEALRLGLDLGITLIDTAEMYGEGGAEIIVGEAMAGRREEVYLVSKVYPHNASRKGTAEACARSLRRLKTGHLDLYLLHWPGNVPLEETLEAFQALKQSGEILDFGVSNFDLEGMKTALEVSGGDQIVTNQVLHNLKERGIEWDLLPWCHQHKIPVMAYSPLEPSPGPDRGLLHHAALASVAKRHRATPAQIALAWLLQKQVVVIPKSSQLEHVGQNRKALDLILTATDLQELDEAFPPPDKKSSLAMR